MQLAGLDASIIFGENAVNATPRLIDPDVAFGGTGLAGGRLSVAGLLAEDRVSIFDEGSGPGVIGFDGTTVRFGGIAIGTASGGVGAPFTVTFNTSVTAAGVDALIERLTYANVSDAPTETRTLTLNVVDGTGSNLGGFGPWAALLGSANPFNGIDAGARSAPAFVDLDGDGDLDLVSGESNGALLAWRNTGTAAAPVFTALTGSANPFNGIDVGGASAPAFLDLDGDGDLDLVSGETDGALLAWRNTGTAAAPVFTALTGSANPFDGIQVNGFSMPAFVDLDGDGDLDLVSGELNGELQPWRNTGTAAAPVFTALTGSANPFSGLDVYSFAAPAFLDLDGDGDRDLVVGGFDGVIGVWRNIGTAMEPVFAALTHTDNPFPGFLVAFSSKPAFLDLDGDGDLDLVSGDFMGALPALRNDAPLPAITVTVTGENDAPVITSAATARVGENSGGIVYQAMATDPDSAFTWSLAGADAGLFSIDATGAVRFLAAPDFETPADAGGNNIHDIVIRATDGSATATRNVAITVADVREGAMLSGFGPGVTFGENAANAAPRLLDADVTFRMGDSLAGGRLVVAGLLAEDRVTILTQGTGAGQIGFDGTTVRFGGVAIGTASGGVGGDFIVTFNASATGAATEALIERLAYANASDAPTGTRTLTLNVVNGTGLGLGGIGTLDALTGSANPFEGIDFGSSSTPAFVDADGDGDLDLVAGSDFGTLQSARNTGTATAAVFTRVTGSENPFNGLGEPLLRSPALVDLDGDGDLDLVMGVESGDMRALRNVGTAAAPVFTALHGSASPFDGLDTGAESAPAFVDLDADGDLDLVVGNGMGTLRAWSNTGSAAAPVFTALTGSDNPFAGIDVGSFAKPAFLDLDGDGDLDLVAGNNLGTLSAWRNTGSAAAPVFTALTGSDNPFAGIHVASFAAPAFLDLDGDGDLDLVSGGLSGQVLAWRNTAVLPAITVTVAAQNDLPTGQVTLAVDSAGRLTASAALADGDGLGPLTLQWQALRGGIWTDLAGATGASFTPGTAEARLLLRAEARFTDAGGTREAVASTMLAQVGSAATNFLSVNDSGVLVLFGLDGDDWLSAEESADAAWLVGGAGHDRLLGGDGDDTLIGGAGDDTYQVAQAGDVVVELPGGGFDRVIASRHWTLGANLERLSLTGTAHLNGTGNGLDNRLDGNAGENLLDGGEGNDTLYGLGGHDTLQGGTGADYLDGGLGADRMVGGAGDDIHVVDHAADVTVEQAGGGFDRVIASLDWTLGAEIERLTLAGTGNPNGTGNGLANRLDGNAGANILDGGEGHDSLYGYGGNDTLIGGAGHDTLDGGLGADSMAGGAGDDAYVVNDPGDVTLELADGGYDRVLASIHWTLGAEFERLSLLGSADLNGMGNGLANRMDGNAGRNTLDGGEGNDRLFGLTGDDTLIGGGGSDALDGGVGADSLTGGLGADRFVFRSAAEADGDAVADFSAAQGDRIDLRPIDANPGLAGDQAFAWIGGAGFGGVAGQLRFANALLEGDVDGNGMADFQIALSGVVALTAADIWL